MEFLLLGPLEVRSSRERLPLGGPRQRALLADLALHAGSVVSMDTLLDDLWSGEPPPTAEAVVQNAVSRCGGRSAGRRSRPARPATCFASTPGRSTRSASSASSATRAAAAGRALGRAARRAGALARAAVRRPRLRAVPPGRDRAPRRAAADRARGPARGGGRARPPRRRDRRRGVAPLPAPRPRAALPAPMLALHRAGRQQEALDAYEATRRALDEQWGLEPSPETRALQMMILTQDPAIAHAEPVARAVGAVRRPVSLLLVEPLLDDDLELEAAGAVLEDVRRRARRRSPPVTAARSRPSRAWSWSRPSASTGRTRTTSSARRARRSSCARSSAAATSTRGYAVGTGQAARRGRPPGAGRRGARPDAACAARRRARTRSRSPPSPLGSAATRSSSTRTGDCSASARAPSRDVGSAPLVGRIAELAGLQSAFDAVVATGRPHHVVVVGEAGIGKSRLVAAFADEVPAVVLEAACIPYGEGISFLPLLELAERAAALDDGAPSSASWRAPTRRSRQPARSSSTSRASGPVVVVLDDMHWAVPTFLDLVEYVVRAVDGPLLVVSVTRPELLEQRPSWGEGATVLAPLPVEDARAPRRRAARARGARREGRDHDPRGGRGRAALPRAARGARGGVRPRRRPDPADARRAAREPHRRARARRARRPLARRRRRPRVLAGVDRALTPEAERRELDGRLASLDRRRLVRPRAVSTSSSTRSSAARHTTRSARGARPGCTSASRGGSTARRGRRARRHAPRARGARLESRQRSRRLVARGGRAARSCRARALLAFDHAAAANLLERAAALLDGTTPERLELECSLGQALKGLGAPDRAVALLEASLERARLGREASARVARPGRADPCRSLDGSLTIESGGRDAR